MEKFTKKYLVVARSILAHPYQVTFNNNLKLNLKLIKSKQTYIWQLFCTFLILFVGWNSTLLLVSFEKYVQAQKFLQLAFHIIWIVCSVAGIAQHVPNLFGSLGVIQLNNCINSITDNFESGKQNKSNIFLKHFLLKKIVKHFLFKKIIFRTRLAKRI